MKDTWYISIEFPNDRDKLTVYNSGLVYGGEKGRKLFVLKSEILKQIKMILKDDINFLKKEKYINLNRNNSILKVNCNNRKNQLVKGKGLPSTKKVFDLLLNKNNYKFTYF